MFSLTCEINTGFLKVCAASLIGLFILAQPAASEIAWTGKDVVITEVDDDGHIQFWWQTAGTAPWHRETVANTSAYGGPSMAWTGSTVVVAALNHNTDSIQYWWAAPGMAEWYPETVATGNYCTSPSMAWTGSAVVITAIDCHGGRFRVMDPPDFGVMDPPWMGYRRSRGLRVLRVLFL
jgi:hypothetical protein